MHATCHKHVTNRGIREAHIEAPNADLDNLHNAAQTEGNSHSSARDAEKEEDETNMEMKGGLLAAN